MCSTAADQQSCGYTGRSHSNCFILVFFLRTLIIKLAKTFYWFLQGHREKRVSHCRMLFYLTFDRKRDFSKEIAQELDYDFIALQHKVTQSLSYFQNKVTFLNCITPFFLFKKLSISMSRFVRSYTILFCLNKC